MASLGYSKNPYKEDKNIFSYKSGNSQAWIFDYIKMQILEIKKCMGIIPIVCIKNGNNFEKSHFLYLNWSNVWKLSCLFYL